MNDEHSGYLFVTQDPSALRKRRWLQYGGVIPMALVLIGVLALRLSLRDSGVGLVTIAWILGVFGVLYAVTGVMTMRQIAETREEVGDAITVMLSWDETRQFREDDTDVSEDIPAAHLERDRPALLVLSDGRWTITWPPAIWYAQLRCDLKQGSVVRVTVAKEKVGIVTISHAGHRTKLAGFGDLPESMR